MTGSSAAASPQLRLQRLLGFLEHDPENLGLLADAAATAFDAGAIDEAGRLLDRYAAVSALPPKLLNLRGLAAISTRRFDEAAGAFEALRADAPDDPGLRFNLAWCRALTGNAAGAVELLDDATIAAAPRAAALKVQMLHQLGPIEDALAYGLGLAELCPDDQALMGALAVVALDAEDAELAEAYAQRAGESHEGLSTLGMLRLNDDQTGPAMALFDRALAAYPDSARGLLGKGLALMLQGDPASAAPHLDRSAEIFGSHVGTWLSAGWAHFLMSDYPGARRCFEAALALDDRFAETQGALAVLDLVENRMESARRRSAVALRLDPECLSGALAKNLIAASAGRAGSADKIRQAALNAPMGPHGRTIAQTMVALGMAGPKGADPV